METQPFIFTTPNIKYKDTYISGIEQLKNEGILRYQGEEIDDLRKNFEKYLATWEERSRGENVPPDRVPDTRYWLIVDDKFVGITYFRYHLNDQLLKYGGHIGYFVVPSERKKGYGTELLKYALIKAREKGLEKVLITCDETNVGSRRIIEKCGGVLENIIDGEKADGPRKCRFWISLV